MIYVTNEKNKERPDGKHQAAFSSLPLAKTSTKRRGCKPSLSLRVLGVILNSADFVFRDSDHTRVNAGRKYALHASDSRKSARHILNPKRDRGVRALLGAQSDRIGS